MLSRRNRSRSAFSDCADNGETNTYTRHDAANRSETIKTLRLLGIRDAARYGLSAGTRFRARRVRVTRGCDVVWRVVAFSSVVPTLVRRDRGYLLVDNRGRDSSTVTDYQPFWGKTRISG